MKMSKDKKTIRMQVWLEAWTKTAQSDSCLRLETPTRYADECLKQFDSRFLESIDKG